MPISRMQQPRQMYGLGSFVKKAVKGVTGAVKNIAKSDVGKAALAIAAVKFGGPLAAKAFPGTFGSAATSPFMRALGRGQFLGDTGIFSAGKTALFGSNAVGPNVKEGLFQRALSKIPGGGVTAGITAASIAGGMLTPEAQEDVQALRQSGDQGLLKTYLERYYRNLNPDADDETVASFVRANAANGGRMGYAFGTDEEEFLKKVKEEDEKMEQDEDYLRKIIDPEDMALSKKRMMKMAEYKESETSKRVKELMDEGYTFGEAVKQAMKEGLKNGGRPGYAMGTPEKNAIQASGIMDLPLNQNPAGVTELDLRETGGFIPPVGVKEKADDIPAMLSNNEFVFTADAVRNMGDGNVNKGAQRMYDFMKYLENGGRV